MRVILIVKGWRDSNLQAALRDDIAEGTFEAGNFFEGEFFLEPEDEKALRDAIQEGYYPEVLINRPAK